VPNRSATIHALPGHLLAAALRPDLPLPDLNWRLQAGHPHPTICACHKKDLLKAIKAASI